jgi:type II secretory pathway pseudopilin PulG
MTGKPQAKTDHTSPCRSQAGFTYLWLLLFVAISSAGIASLSDMCQSQVQRGKEEELVFRLQQFAAALDSYAKASPVGVNCQPLTLDELLEDRRLGTTKRHLRSLYPDPFTGKWDWLVERGAGGVITRIKNARPLTFVTRNTGASMAAAEGDSGNTTSGTALPLANHCAGTQPPSQ